MYVVADDADGDVTVFSVNDRVCVYPRLPEEGMTELPFACAEDTLFWMARIDGIRSGKDGDDMEVDNE